MYSLVTSIFPYACESWTLTAELHRRIQATEMGCYRKILRISYRDHVTNEEVCQDPSGNWTTRRPPDHRKETQTEVVWTCLPFIRSGEKKILQGTVKGGRGQCIQKKRWEDNIKKWTGLEFGKSHRAVENREKWRKLVAKSSVVPQRPSRLRD